MAFESVYEDGEEEGIFVGFFFLCLSLCAFILYKRGFAHKFCWIARKVLLWIRVGGDGVC